jgi:hypothetical protein
MSLTAQCLVSFYSRCDCFGLSLTRKFRLTLIKLIYEIFSGTSDWSLWLSLARRIDLSLAEQYLCSPKERMLNYLDLFVFFYKRAESLLLISDQLSYADKFITGIVNSVSFCFFGWLGAVLISSFTKTPSC